MSTKNIYRESFNIAWAHPKMKGSTRKTVSFWDMPKNETLVVSKWDTRPASEPKALPCKPGKAAGKALGLAWKLLSI
jgi:hypothetical protein